MIRAAGHYWHCSATIGNYRQFEEVRNTIRLWATYHLSGLPRTDGQSCFRGRGGLSEAGLKGEQSARAASIDEVTSPAKNEIHRRTGVVFLRLLLERRDSHSLQFRSHDNSDADVGEKIQTGSNKARGHPGLVPTTQCASAV